MLKFFYSKQLDTYFNLDSINIIVGKGSINHANRELTIFLKNGKKYTISNSRDIDYLASLL